MSKKNADRPSVETKPRVEQLRDIYGDGPRMHAGEMMTFDDALVYFMTGKKPSQRRDAD